MCIRDRYYTVTRAHLEDLLLCSFLLDYRIYRNKSTSRRLTCYSRLPYIPQQEHFSKAYLLLCSLSQATVQTAIRALLEDLSLCSLSQTTVYTATRALLEDCYFVRSRRLPYRPQQEHSSRISYFVTLLLTSRRPSCYSVFSRRLP